MTIAFVDTTVIIHLLRQYPPALVWYASQPQTLSIASNVWLEVMEGAPSKVAQARYKSILNQFEVLYPTSDDQQWAMQSLERFQFSHHIGKDDCVIAALAYRLQLPLYSHNLKDMTPMIGSLAIKPYV